VEGRNAIGGTWDLFRYPGVRSDSDLQTLAFSDRPVFNGAITGEGADILAYIEGAARESGVDKKILFEHRVVAADFDKETGLWQVEVAIGPEKRAAHLSCRFLYSCCGYYDYATGYTPEFPGIAEFSGRILHPQFWPADFDASGKRIVVIGSGATAISLIPAIAAKASHIVMLQRSPSYLMPLPGKDYDGRFYQRILPKRIAYALIRWRNIFVTFGLYHLARAKPEWSKKQLLNLARKRLALSDEKMSDFTPRYEVWDQRLCFDPGFAFYNCLRDGSASIVTAEIDAFVPAGLRLRNGETLRADAIVTATGLKLQTFGGAKLSIDGKAIEPGKLVIYKGCMFAGVPNLVAAIGYINASWTLKCQLTTIYLLRLLREMAARNVKWVAPQNAPAPAGPIMALTSGYVERAKAGMLKQGATAPWRYSVNYLRDFWTLRFGPVDDGALHFEESRNAPTGPQK
jgi:cation diffusion facilitator CzcD-associated flavoprotein CzcO